MSSSLTPIAWNFCPICGAPLVLYTDGEQDRPHCNACRRHFYSNPTPASCCFVTRGDDLLLGKRGIHPRKGHWALPGGYVELDETTAQTAVRELREETGLEAAHVQLIGASTQNHVMTGAVVVLGYVVEAWQGELRPGSDVTDLRFFPLHAVPRLPFRAHRDLFAIFKARRAGQPLPRTGETQPVE